MFSYTTPQKIQPIRIKKSRCVFDAITPNLPIMRCTSFSFSGYLILLAAGGGQMRASGNEVGRKYVALNMSATVFSPKESCVPRKNTSDLGDIPWYITRKFGITSM